MMAEWRAYRNETGGVTIALKRAHHRLPWRCDLRESGMSENCPCARFSDNSCVPRHIMPDFERRRDAAYAAKTQNSDGSWSVSRDFANVEAYQWDPA